MKANSSSTLDQPPEHTMHSMGMSKCISFIETITILVGKFHLRNIIIIQESRMSFLTTLNFIASCLITKKRSISLVTI